MVASLYDLTGKTALITGGGTGLGFAISKLFVEAGAKVIITGRREEVLKDATSRIEGNIHYTVNDITDLTTIPHLVDQAESEIGPIDILVNNAGVNMKKDPRQVTDEEFQKIIQTNLNGVFSLTREVAARMEQRGAKGSIIMMGSMAAIYGISNVSAYTASKSAIVGLTRSLAVDFSPKGIRVNTISPGFIDSPMLRKAFDTDPERKRKVLDRTPMQELGQPDDIAKAALFLATDASRFITGVNLPVDGGNSIGF